LQAEAEATVVRTQAQAEAERVQISAEARAVAAEKDAAAMKILAEATLAKGESEAEAKRKLIEAENARATKFLLREVALKALDVLPQVTAELMTPAKAISEIKVLQFQGGPGSNGSGGDGNAQQSGAFGAASPILKTVLEAGAAYPLLREMMAFTQTDTDKLAGLARGFLQTLPGEVRKIVESDPAIAAKLDEMSGADIHVSDDGPRTPRRPATAPAGGE
jgi:flotillin